MTASMILWTLELLEWIKEQLPSSWPDADLRGSEPGISPEPYRIRFRDSGKQYWLVLSPDAIRSAPVEDVVSLLESVDWVPTLKRDGGIWIDVAEPDGPAPVLLPWPEPGPEINPELLA